MNKALFKILDVVKPVDFEASAYPHVAGMKKEFHELFKDYGEDITAHPEWVKKRMRDISDHLKKIQVKREDKITVVIRELHKLASTITKTDTVKGVQVTKPPVVFHPIRHTNSFFYVWDYGYWHQLDDRDMLLFFSKVAAKMGIPAVQADYHKFRSELMSQAQGEYHANHPEPDRFATYISLLNGYVKITKQGVELVNPIPELFMTYRLKYKYNPDADCPQFKKFFDRARPGEEWQRIIMEYVGYIFSNGLKLERVMLLCGSGSNGKSVFFEIIKALVGSENCTSYSLEGLTDDAGNQRAAIENKLLNYSSEISKKMNVDIFKQLISGEPVQARWLFKNTMNITRYAKLMFNCNNLPMNNDSTNAYYRRLIIVPFEAVISQAEADPEMHIKIIGKADILTDDLTQHYEALIPSWQGELSGVFNLAMEGLARLYQNMRFSETAITKEPVNQYALESNSALMFFEEIGLEPDESSSIPLAELYAQYKKWCDDYGYKNLAKKNLSVMLKQNGYKLPRHGLGVVVYARKPGQVTTGAHEYFGVHEKVPF